MFLCLFIAKSDYSPVFFITLAPLPNSFFLLKLFVKRGKIKIFLSLILLNIINDINVYKKVNNKI